MSLSTGIIGLPNVGKTTLFNALTEGSAEATNYPFCTIDPNVGVVEVLDPRLEQLEALLQPVSCTPTAIQFTDIAGLVRGASQGEGRGNEFLSQVRETDALVHVVRCFEDPTVAHVSAALDPLRDVAVVESELILADLQIVANVLPTLDKRVQSDPRSPRQLELDVLHRLEASMLEGVPAAALALSTEEQAAIRGYNFLSAKPVLYVANVREAEAATGGDWLQAMSDRVGEGNALAVSAQIEAEITQLPPDEREGFLGDLGLERSGIERLISAAYDLLGLITFYTHAHDKLQAWQLVEGLQAPEAAGRIHTDMRDGFIRVEVAAYEDLLGAGQTTTLREQGRLRTEGRDYVIGDGDVLNFLFRP